MLGEGTGTYNLWLFLLKQAPHFEAFIQGMSNEELEKYNYKLTHQELLPDCPYVWAVANSRDRLFFWDGEKTTRVYVAAPDEEADYLTSVGAVKLSGEEKNEAPISLWYYSSDDPVLPERFPAYPYVWRDLLTEEDFYYPEDALNEDDYPDEDPDSFDD